MSNTNKVSMFAGLDALLEGKAADAAALFASALGGVWPPRRALKLALWGVERAIDYDAARAAGAEPLQAAVRAGMPTFRAGVLEARRAAVPRARLDDWAVRLAAAADDPLADALAVIASLESAADA
jgi:hypothetical protein